ncbi:MAG: VOC family protein [Actinomycetia bacterium]|nr:VOC family protein [Actinomycetes bacterium]
MTLRIECLTIDCSDPELVASFWESALGYRRDFQDDTEIAIAASTGTDSTDLLFLRVPDAKRGKNRLHLDLRPDDRAAEVARLEGLGARRVEIGQDGAESWVVMADPEGNEFCVLRALGPDDSVYEGSVGAAPTGP